MGKSKNSPLQKKRDKTKSFLLYKKRLNEYNLRPNENTLPKKRNYPQWLLENLAKLKYIYYFFPTLRAFFISDVEIIGLPI